MEHEIQQQLNIIDSFSMQNLQVPPEYDWSLWDTIHPQALDVYYSAYPDTPVYLIIKRMGKASPLMYKALICTYTGWWHGLQGWNIENKYIEGWVKIDGYTVSDFIGKGVMLALTPQQYEKNKNKTVEEIIDMVLKDVFRE